MAAAEPPGRRIPLHHARFTPIGFATIMLAMSIEPLAWRYVREIASLPAPQAFI